MKSPFLIRIIFHLKIFKVNRHSEENRFMSKKRLGNRKLLWHGSRVTNFAGILSQGLRIAPPEAPSASVYKMKKERIGNTPINQR